MCYFGDRDVTEKSKKYPGLEQLSTAELEDLLRRDFAASEDDDASMALITEIMEVIQDREAQQELPVDEDTAWEMFLLESLSYSNLSAWYSGSGVQLIYLAVISLVFTAIVIACAAGVRKKKSIV